ncbi:MAG: methyltransferase domain-containing protein [Bacteroidota bacterium]|nr:methyltransferase domain-containing protein [Bacteroidota bacterium]
MEERFDLIADFDLNMICNFFRQLDRQGPGSEDETIKALSFIKELPINAKIADLGCGTGGQTITLANNISGDIIAVDLFPGMIEYLDKRVKQQGLEDRITGLIASMGDLPFSDNEFDLIWAEGSIYHIGFEKGLNEWMKYLKPGGFIAVTEATWLTSNRPIEIERYWNENYPEINTASFKLKQLEQAGYNPIATFVLPESCWSDIFYKPMADHFDSFLKEYNYSESARQFVKRQKEEIAYYELYKKYYGYVFYIGQKPE